MSIDRSRSERDARVASVLTLALLLVCVAPRADAASYTWIKIGGGYAVDGANWSPNGVPGANDDVSFGPPASFGVTWASPADTIQSLTILNSHPMFTIATRLGVRFHPVLENNSSLSVSGGRIDGPSWSMVENNASATLGLSGPTTEVWAMAPSTTSLFGAKGGNAGLSIGNGAAFQSAGEISLAPNGTTMTVEIGQASGKRSLLATTTAGVPGRGWIAVGDYGAATLGVGIGGKLSPAGDLFIGRHPGASGQVQLETYTGLVPLVDARGQVFVGANDEAGTAGGIGVVDVQLGTFSSLGRCWLGDPDDPPPGDPLSPSARLLVEGGIVVLAGGLTSSPAGSGRLELRGGATHITGGTIDLRQATPFEIGISTGTTPLLFIENHTTGDIWAPDASHPALGLGRGGTGGLYLAGAGTALTIHGALVMADTIGGGATLVADTSSTLTVQGKLLMGGGGASFLTVKSPSAVATFLDSALIGAPGTAGFGVFVADSMGTAHLLGRTTVGASVTGQIRCFRGGRIDISGLTLGPANGLLEVGGDASTVTVSDHFDGFGAATVLIDRGGLLAYTATGHGATFGSAAPGSPNSFIAVNNGALAQFASELDEFGELDLMPYDTLEPLSAPPGAPPAPRIRPTTPSRVAIGPVIGGRLECPLVRLRANGHIVVTGAIAGRLHMESGVCTMQVSYNDQFFQGRGIVGDSIATDGFVSIGTTTIGLDTLQVLDSDGGDLGKMTIAGGDLQLPKPGHLKSGFLLSGYGTVEGSLDVRDSAWVSFHGQVTGDVALAGTLDLGPAAAALILGALHPAGTGRTTIKVGHLNQDAVIVLGAAALGGTLDIRTMPGDLPLVGDTITVISASSLSGTFTTLRFNGRPATGVATVLYRGGDVRVAITGAVTAVHDGPPAGPSPPVTLRFAAIGGPRDAALALDLPAAANVRVALYDVSGRQLAVLEDADLAAGRHRYEVARVAGASGMVFARAMVTTADGRRTLTARAIVLR